MIFDGAVPNGTITTLCIPAAAAYAATDAAAFPVDITVATAKPSSLALEMPTLLLRSLSDPVGKTVSFFKYSRAMLSRSPSRVAWINGVEPSPRDMMDVRLSTAHKSTQRQILRSGLCDIVC